MEHKRKNIYYTVKIQHLEIQIAYVCKRSTKRYGRGVKKIIQAVCIAYR